MPTDRTPTLALDPATCDLCGSGGSEPGAGGRAPRHCHRCSEAIALLSSIAQSNGWSAQDFVREIVRRDRRIQKARQEYNELSEIVSALQQRLA
jgi:hypothetical protein